MHARRRDCVLIAFLAHLRGFFDRRFVLGFWAPAFVVRGVLGRAVQAVRDGEADAAISAGNTGALMAMAKVCLKTMAHVERPAIAAMWPTLRGESIVLDVGATIGADAGHLVDMAIMGAAMARIVFDLDRPSVGLLNVGTEEIKGIETVREAGRILRTTDFP